MLIRCHTCGIICGTDSKHSKFTYLVNYPLGLAELNFCSEEHRDEYIKEHIAEYYRGIPIYQQFNYCNGETAYMLNYLDNNYTLDIQNIRDYIDDILKEK